ncbi:MAG: SMP-30/gluconolactonase/LRE family protein [Victivallales bacterium]|nr:SMP-30/gluconolactonase/LRE family protein [Victivallales bacterium]
MEKTSDSITLENGFKLFAACQCEVGEGPLWNSSEKMLYWIDVSRGAVFRKYPHTPPADFEKYQLQIGKIGGFVFLENNELLLFADQGKVWKWRPGKSPLLTAELKAAAETRFNDVIADPEGRVFCGVAPAVPGGSGSLWRMDTDGSFTLIEPETAGMPNGMGFSSDFKYFYFTVTNERIIYRYGYKRETGAVNAKTAFIKVPENEGRPDGMTVDKEDCIWSAQWEGSRLVRYSPEGEKMTEYMFPIAKISCVIFGGKNDDEIFVTTANHPWNEEDYKSNHAGSVFSL